MLNILRTRFSTTNCCYKQIRQKVTLNKVDASKASDITRPTPILLLRTKLSATAKDNSNEWAHRMQEQFSRAGYYSVDATITLPEKSKDQSLLQSCYAELNQATSDLSFFPPLIVSYGEIATRISQKFVSNKPASGLVMIQQKDEQESSELLCRTEFPVSEFEPRFPLLMISNKLAPEFLDGWIDQIELKQGQEFNDLIEWMDGVGM